MVETVSLLQEIRTSGYEGAVLTTYNLHIPFLEEVVLRRLHASGCRHIAVLADQNQLAKAVATDTPRRAGRDYMLLPMPTQTAFHPKIMLLAGNSKGILAVGSHNLTYAGFGHNREVTNAIRYNAREFAGNAAIVRNTWHVLQHWMESVGTDDESMSLLARLPHLAPWLGKDSDADDNQVQILVGEPNAEPLFTQLGQFIDEPLESVFLTGPFFDSKLEFISALVDQFEPKNTVVSLDPSTAHIPSAAKDLSDVSFVRSDDLGPKNTNYLHAKVIHAVGRSGAHYLLAGSANPSAPAWLRGDSRANHEAMIALRGKLAKSAAKDLGLLSTKQATELADSDWESIEAQWAARADKQSDDETHAGVVFASVSEDGKVIIPQDDFLKGASARLFGPSGAALDVSQVVETTPEGTLQIAMPHDVLVSLIHILSGEDIVRLVIVHYPGALQEKARTGVQRRFSTAFGSLDSDTPALNELFKCIEQVIDEDEPTAPAKLRAAPKKGERAGAQAPGSLEVSVDDIHHGHKRKQLTAGTNLGYILDILIRSLGQDLVAEYDDVDAFGRNEEEQVGADDENSESAARSDTHAGDVLDLCHKKIRRLVSRAERQLEAFADGKISDRNVVIKLTAVIGLFSQLRGQDKHIWWVNVPRGESTVPGPSMTTLMKSVAKTLLSHPLFLYEPQSEDDDVPSSDEYARLRGLIFWLGAQAGISLLLEAPFNEKIEDRTTRIQANQDFLALGDLVAGDELAAAAAEEAIITTDVELGATLERAINFRTKINEKMAQKIIGDEISAGDFAFNPKQLGLGVRAVLHADGRFVELAAPGGTETKRFVTDSLIGIPAEELGQ